MRWIACVPNVSEGRRPEVIDAIAAAAAAPGARLLAR
jgi:glutamate formiminotransferase